MDNVLVGAKYHDDSLLFGLAPGLAVAPYVWDIQQLSQTNLLILAMTLAALVALRHQHTVLAGSLFGQSVMLKTFAMPAISYFVVRRKWKAVFDAVHSVIREIICARTSRWVTFLETPLLVETVIRARD